MLRRLEHGFPGSRDVPDEAGRGIHALRALENFPLLGRPMQQGLSGACGAARVASAKEPR
jgi:aspartate ammonia-lyase